jgi:uncharacterized protein
MAYPSRPDATGKTAQSEEDEHVEEMILQVLFTQPGERVNRPTFGSGLMQMVFGKNSDEIAAATSFLVQGALQQTLGDRITLDDLQVDSVDSTLSVQIVYTIKATREQKSVTFVRET